MKESIHSIVAAFVKAEPGLNHSEIADAILEEYPEIGLSHRTLRQKVSQYRSGDDEIEMKTEKPEEKCWVEDEIYHIVTKYGTLKMPVKTIDKIFLHYSKYGHNMTGDEIQAKFDLKPHEWVALKNILNLYKTSDIFSPHTRSVTPVKELEVLMENEMEKLFRNKGIVVKKYNQTLHREWKRSIEKQNLQELEKDILSTEILENLDIVNGQEYIIPLTSFTENAATGVVVLSDFHFGAKYKTKTHQYTMYNVEKALEHIAEIVNSQSYEKVIVVFLGDLIHNFKEMHKGMWQETDIEEGIGGKLIINSAHLLAKFATKIHNFSEFHIVEGNHDRATDKSDRISNELTQVIAEMVRGLISAPIHYHGPEGVLVEEGINYIFSHGDRPLDKKDVYRIINRAGVFNRNFSMVLKGHNHSRMKGSGTRGSGSGDDNYDSRHVHAPSLFTLDTYTHQLGFHALAGFLTIEKFSESSTGMSLPLVKDFPIDVTACGQL